MHERLMKGSILRTASVAVVLMSSLAIGQWKPAAGPLMTRWAKDVSPEKVLPEYPRPQMTRRNWMSLNGLWDYAIRPKDAGAPSWRGRPALASTDPNATKEQGQDTLSAKSKEQGQDALATKSFDGQILVPYPVESALSGVMKPVGPDNRLWYRRTFEIPEGRRWSGQGRRVLLHFGAVDWDATVWVNGKELGNHKGGYDPFTFDITDALKESGQQEIVLSVWDPTDAGTQPRGKQVRQPNGIWYTAVTGIWQTVWLEPVPAAYIGSLEMVPDIDAGVLKLKVNAQGNIADPSKYRVTVTFGSRPAPGTQRNQDAAPVAGSGAIGEELKIPVSEPKLWSPDSPHLYTILVSLTESTDAAAGTQEQQGRRFGRGDTVEAYFAMRKIAMQKDEAGVNRLFLNNKPLFQYGPLDQGWWPDGLYTAPTDEALKYDIEVTKRLGMNLARKHVKVEPDRWYYWCDKLGLLVWQDMPSGDAFIGGNDPDVKRSEESAKQYELELTRIIDAYRNHPSIVMWVPFNEGWGQFDTPRVVDMVKKLDPTRLVDNASGWTDRGVGDVMDIHTYPGPEAPRIEAKRAGVLGEFGGLGLPLPGHTWQAEKNWGYRSYTTRDELTDAYVTLIKKLHPLTGRPGLSAAVYTQTTDVEVEVNGLMTYDREIIKMDAARITAANQTLYTPPQPRQSQGDKLIPPATPLVACDPFFSIWSPADNLTDEDTTHWTGKPHRITSMVRVDGKPYRVMGVTPGKAPAMKQTGLTVLPTRTIYTFEGAGIALTLTFMTPALPEDIAILSRPVTYLTYDFRATDDKKHEVQVYFDAAAELAVNTANQQVVWAAEEAGDLAVCKVGSKDQPVLAKKGDDIRIDWGYLYIAARKDAVASRTFAGRGVVQNGFADDGLQSAVASPESPAGAEAVCAALALKPQTVSKKPVSCWLMVAYDDLYSIQYMKKNLRPYWRRNGWEAADLLKASAKDYKSLKKSCAAFDEKLMADLTKVGGEQYARLAALAYRQCFAAGKFVADGNGQPMQFCKENHSNGCIGTSDVFYPMAPQFLLFGPSVAKSFLVPFMNYATSERWKFPFAPHDLGQYPHANGQVYGGGERTEQNQMPVEETGNLLLLIAAVAQMEGNADFAGLYWPQLEKWADYLKAKGFDPENQLCTDDFAGHLAHNVNLSAKAICGLGAFGKLCEMRGDKAKASEYSKVAKEFAARWVKEADAGDHFRLAFDKPDTWSQKYNLVWDRILGLNLFPPEVAQKEMAYYKKIQNKFGLPLDNRSLYTKLDWVVWTATLTQNRKDFEALVTPVYRFLNETPDRSPMTDWYFTDNARKRGFTARPVVGGVFIPMLYHKDIWQKYAGRDKTKAKGWAPMPKPPIVTTVVPTAQDEPAVWRYTTRRPGQDWFKPEFDATMWREGKSGFGTRDTPGAAVNTVWDTRDIWLRREFTLPEGRWDDIGLTVHHDEDVEIYINGVQAVTANGYTVEYEPMTLTPAGLAALKPGKNLIAVHCRQTSGGQYIDLGLVKIVEQK